MKLFKKIISSFLLLTLVLPTLVSCDNNTLVCMNAIFPSIKASSSQAFIYNISDDEYIFLSSDGTDKVTPASTTKLLTALLALEILPSSTLITPGDEVYLPPDNSSSAFIRPHHTLSLEMLIEAMIVPSGNDAAYAVAAACGRELANDDLLEYSKAVAHFVDEMNAYAKKIGCTGSNFTVPDGFAGDEHYSTVQDMAIIAKKASECEIIMKYASLQSDSVVYASGHTNTWTNTNEQLDPDSEFYNQNICGLKTGSLDKSYSLISVYNDGVNKFIIGVFGAKSDSARYSDTKVLIDAILKNKSDVAVQN